MILDTSPLVVILGKEPDSVQFHARALAPARKPD